MAKGGVPDGSDIFDYFKHKPSPNSGNGSGGGGGELLSFDLDANGAVIVNEDARVVAVSPASGLSASRQFKPFEIPPSASATSSSSSATGSAGSPTNAPTASSTASHRPPSSSGFSRKRGSGSRDITSDHGE